MLISDVASIPFGPQATTVYLPEELPASKVPSCSIFPPFAVADIIAQAGWNSKISPEFP